MAARTVPSPVPGITAGKMICLDNPNAFSPAGDSEYDSPDLSHPLCLRFPFCGIHPALVYPGVPEKNEGDEWKPALDTWLVYLPAFGFFIIPALYILTPFLAAADYTLPEWAGWAGAVLFAGALLLLWRSHADLGANFTPVAVVQEGQRLVTTGVYRYIRHPMYAAHFLWAFAQPLLLWNWIAGFALLITFIPLYYVRVPVEEGVLAGRFGEEYREYMERTGRIVPKFGQAHNR